MMEMYEFCTQPQTSRRWEEMDPEIAADRIIIPGSLVKLHGAAFCGTAPPHGEE